jgi:hypothetical protein
VLGKLPCKHKHVRLSPGHMHVSASSTAAFAKRDTTVAVAATIQASNQNIMTLSLAGHVRVPLAQHVGAVVCALDLAGLLERNA